MTVRKPNMLFPLLFAFMIFSVPVSAADTCNGRQIVGTRTVVSFPQFGLHRLKAKTDTGAYTSSLHCSGITVDYRNHTVTCRPPGLHNPVTLPYTRLGSVKSSNGTVGMRPFVQLEIIILGRRYQAEFSLTDRADMKNAVLIGRKLLRGHFVVDVTR